MIDTRVPNPPLQQLLRGDVSAEQGQLDPPKGGHDHKAREQGGFLENKKRTWHAMQFRQHAGGVGGHMLIWLLEHKYRVLLPI